MFYLDLFIEQNFLMNLIVLSLTKIFNFRAGPRRYVQRIVAALIGALISAGCLVLQSYVAFVFLTAFFAVPFMIVIAYGKRTCRQWGRDILLSWLSMIVLNGVASAVFQITGIQSLTIYSGILVLGIASVLVRTLMRSLKRQNSLMQVLLCHGGHSIGCVGLYDSGNRLTMPDTGEPVHIVSQEIMDELGITKSCEREIYFSSLGNENGRIGVVQVEQMQIAADGKELCYRNVWMGCAGRGLLKNREYQMILHSSIHRDL